MRVTVYGGINEIGGNKILVEDGDTRVFLDFGMSFSRHQTFFDEYVKPRPVLRDLLKLKILPEVDGIYREDLIRPANWKDATAGGDWPEPYWSAPVLSAVEYRAKHGRNGVDAVVLTHAHADHVNHVSYLDPAIPIYANATTRALVHAISDVSRGGLENQFYEVTPREFAQSESGYFPKSWGTKKRTTTIERAWRTVDDLTPFRVGSLTITLVPADHSVPGATGVFVQGSDGKRLFYTGDVRFHGRLVERQRAMRDFTRALAPDLLLCEGTRIKDDDPADRDTEEDVERELAAGIGAARGLAMVDFSWKDTTRFDTLERVARATGRTLLVPPKLAYLLARLERDVGGFRGLRGNDAVRPYLDRRDSLLYSLSDYTNAKHVAGEAAEWRAKSTIEDWSADERARNLANFEAGVRAPRIRAEPDRFIVTLSFFEMSDLFDFDPPAGSVYYRCACEPFNDEMRLDERKQDAWLAAFGINAEGGSRLRKAHVSGHGSGVDLKPFARAMEAPRLLPIHTVDFDRFAGLARDVVEWGPRPGDPVTIAL